MQPQFQIRDVPNHTPENTKCSWKKVHLYQYKKKIVVDQTRNPTTSCSLPHPVNKASFFDALMVAACARWQRGLRVLKSVMRITSSRNSNSHTRDPVMEECQSPSKRQWTGSSDIQVSPSAFPCEPIFLAKQIEWWDTNKDTNFFFINLVMFPLHNISGIVQHHWSPWKNNFWPHVIPSRDSSDLQMSNDIRPVSETCQ